MKCPACQFICSELRDICPKCFVDMRPYKRSLRLPITNARASYQELLTKTKQKVVKAPEAQTTTMFSWLAQKLAPHTNSIIEATDALNQAQQRAKLQSAQDSQTTTAAATATIQPPSQASITTEPQAASAVVATRSAPPESIDQQASLVSSNHQILSALSDQDLQQPNLNTSGEEVVTQATQLETKQPETEINFDFEDQESQSLEPESENESKAPASNLKQQELYHEQSLTFSGELQESTTAAPVEPAQENISDDALEAFSDPTQETRALTCDTELEDQQPETEFNFDFEDPESQSLEPESENESKAPAPHIKQQELPGEQSFIFSGELQESTAAAPEEPFQENISSEALESLSDLTQETEEPICDVEAPAQAIIVNPQAETEIFTTEQLITQAVVEKNEIAQSDIDLISESAQALQPDGAPDEIQSKEADLPANASSLLTEASARSSEVEGTQVKAENSIESAEIAELFDQTIEEFTANDQFELSFEVLNTQYNSEDIKLLFELSNEEICDPQAAARYTKEIAKSASRHVENQALQQQLEKVEKIIEGPALTLKSGISHGQTLPGTADNSHNEAWINLPTAPIQKRLYAFAIDTFVATGITMALTALYAFNFERDLLFYTIQGQWGNLIEYFGLFAVATSLLIVQMCLYPLILLLSFKTTPGLHYCQLKLIRENGRPAHYSNFLVRSLIFPISVLTLGSWVFRAPKRTLHDALARTELVPVSFKLPETV